MKKPLVGVMGPLIGGCLLGAVYLALFKNFQKTQ
jgi:hypothetical protein